MQQLQFRGRTTKQSFINQQIVCLLRPVFSSFIVITITYGFIDTHLLFSLRMKNY